MPTYLKTIVVLVLPVLFVACGEDEEPREPLIIGTWSLADQELTNVTAEAAGLSADVTNQLPEEYRNLPVFPEDATITFNEDRTYVVDTPGDAAVLTGSWELSDDEETITITGLEAAEELLGSNSLSFTIQEINATNFSLLASVSDIQIPDNIEIPGLPPGLDLSSVSFSGDYRLDLRK